MKLRSRFRIIFLTAIILSLLMSSQVFATESIDPDEEVNFEIRYRYKDEDGDVIPLPNARFGIYLVATMDEDGDHYTLTDDFSSFDGDITNISTAEDMTALASSLMDYINNNNISPTDLGHTNDNGKLLFPTDDDEELQDGLYLVLGGDLTYNSNVYRTTPFMTTLPVIDDELWQYYIVAIPKVSMVASGRPSTPTDPENPDTPPSDPTPDNPPDDPTPDTPSDEPGISLLSEDYPVGYLYGSVGDNDTSANDALEANVPGELMPTLSGSFIPQTGQLWWPVPVMVAFGLTFIVIGLIRRRNITDEEC